MNRPTIRLRADQLKAGYTISSNDAGRGAKIRRVEIATVDSRGESWDDFQLVFITLTNGHQIQRNAEDLVTIDAAGRWVRTDELQPGDRVYNLDPTLKPESPWWTVATIRQIDGDVRCANVYLESPSGRLVDRISWTFTEWLVDDEAAAPAIQLDEDAAVARVLEHNLGLYA